MRQRDPKAGRLWSFGSQRRGKDDADADAVCYSGVNLRRGVSEREGHRCDGGGLQKCVGVSSSGFWILSGVYCDGIFAVYIRSQRNTKEHCQKTGGRTIGGSGLRGSCESESKDFFRRHEAEGRDRAGILVLDEPTAGLDPKERVRFRNLLSDCAGDKIIVLSTHIVSDIEAVADEVLLMKKGKFVLQGSVPDLIKKAEGKVWELAVPQEETRKWQAGSTVANLRHEGSQVVLRIISEHMPAETAVPCEASLEDLYLYYFPTEQEGVS